MLYCFISIVPMPDPMSDPTPDPMTDPTTPSPTTPSPTTPTPTTPTPRQCESTSVYNVVLSLATSNEGCNQLNLVSVCI